MKTVHEFFVALQKLGLPAHPSLLFRPYPISKEDPHWYLCGHTVTREQDVNDLLVMHANRHFKLRCVTLDEVLTLAGVTENSYLRDVFKSVRSRLPWGLMQKVGYDLEIDPDLLKISHLRKWVGPDLDSPFNKLAATMGVGPKVFDACVTFLKAAAAHP